MPRALERLDAPPVFITGSARSGTTWTLDVFGHHPQVCAILESWVLTQTHGVTGIFAQREWNPAASKSAQDRVGQRHAAVQLLSYEEMVRDVGALVARWLMRPVAPEHRFLVAKEPLDVAAAATMFPEARFVHVVRDGRDVALSMRRASTSWDPSMGVGLPMSWRAEVWRRQVENVRAHRKTLQGRYLEIRFEELKADIVTAARSLFDFSSIPYDDAVLERIRKGSDVTGYDPTVRRSGFRGPGEAGGWRAAFNLRDAWGFNRAAGDLLVDLGYEHDKTWYRDFIPVPARSRIRGS